MYSSHKVYPSKDGWKICWKIYQNVVPFLQNPFFSKQGGRKQIFYGGARLNRKKSFLPKFAKFWNFYYINPKKMGGPVPPRPPQFRPPWPSLLCLSFWTILKDISYWRNTLVCTVHFNLYFRVIQCRLEL